MPLVHKGVGMLAGKLPKVITPKAHAIVDYCVAGTFFLMGGLFWRRNKKAAISSLICGGAAAVNTVFTDYPGGLVKEISFPTHGKIDWGLGAVTYAMPDMMEFKDDKEAWFFRTMSLAETSVTAMTDFHALERGRGRWRRAA